MKMRWIDVMRDVALLWVLPFMAEVVVLVMYGKDNGHDPNTVHVLATAKKAMLIIGFAMAGYLGRKPSAERLRHLLRVFFGFWLINLTNIHFVENYTLSLWFMGAWILALYAFVGGGLSFLFAPPAEPASAQPKDESAAPEPALGEPTSDDTSS